MKNISETAISDTAIVEIVSLVKEKTKSGKLTWNNTYADGLRADVKVARMTFILQRYPEADDEPVIMGYVASRQIFCVPSGGIEKIVFNPISKDVQAAIAALKSL